MEPPVSQFREQHQTFSGIYSQKVVDFEGDHCQIRPQLLYHARELDVEINAYGGDLSESQCDLALCDGSFGDIDSVADEEANDDYFIALITSSATPLLPLPVKAPRKEEAGGDEVLVIVGDGKEEVEPPNAGSDDG